MIHRRATVLRRGHTIAMSEGGLILQGIRFSVVIPVYNEEAVVRQAHARLTGVMEKTGEPYELLFVNDGSRDRTLEILLELCEADSRTKLISFSRNFGHQSAVSAGLEHACGQAVVIIDADLQDPPEIIPEMIGKWREGYEVVYGRRVKRKGESLFKRCTAAVYYRCLRLMADIDIPVDAGDFRLLDRSVCAAVNRMPESNRFLRGLVSWAGFRQTSVEYVRDPRWAGETKYPLHKMIRFALNGIFSFSYRPLKLATYLGLFFSLGSFAYLTYVIITKLLYNNMVSGWASLAAINLFFNGLILLVLGIIGEYIGRIYDECKRRPLYIISGKCGFDDDGPPGGDWREPKTRRPA